MIPACGRLINDGGEGKIFEVKGNSSLCLKIYKDNSQGKPIVTKELQHKLEYMRNNPPESLINKGCLAWPVDIFYSQGNLAGFVMPKLVFDTSLLKIYSYKHPLIDKNYNSYPTVQSRIGIAINLASAVSELHNARYVIGDFNHENIGIDRNTAQIRIVDCDSFTITDNSGITLRTNFCMPGYVAPEIINHCHSERAKGHPYELDVVALPTFTKESDLFCLAVHIFRSLMNGVHPFNGVKDNAVGSNAAPFVGNEGIERNNYVFKSGLHPSNVYCLNPNEIPPNIKSLFDRAFLDGDRNPKSRPTAVEWYNALLSYHGSLKQCPDNPKHQYYNVLSKCPFCEADERHYAIQSGKPQPKNTYNNRPSPQPYRPVTLAEADRVGEDWNSYTTVPGVVTTRPASIPPVRYGSQPQHPSFSANHKKSHKLRNTLIAAVVVAIGFVIIKPKIPAIYQFITQQVVAQTETQSLSTNTNKESDSAASQKENKTSSTNNSAEAFPVAKYVHKDLNVHEDAELRADNIKTVVRQDSLVYLSNTVNKNGASVKIQYKDGNRIDTGWVNGTYLRDFRILAIKIGNHDDNGNWIIQPGGTLYASQIKHLGIELYFDTENGYDKKTTFYVKISYPAEGYIQGKNSPNGFSATWTNGVTNNNHYTIKTSDISGSYYNTRRGTWIIEIWYHDPRNDEEEAFACIASKTFELK